MFLREDQRPGTVLRIRLLPATAAVCIVKGFMAGKLAAVSAEHAPYYFFAAPLGQHHRSPAPEWARLARLGQRVIHKDLFRPARSEEHTSELQSIMRSPYAGLCLNKKKSQKNMSKDS